MGLLVHDLSATFTEIADAIYQRQFEEDPALGEEYDQRQKKRMYEDILHNLSFLEVSYELDDDKLFTDYAQWLLKLMLHLMPDLPAERIKEQMIHHYRLLDEALKDTLTKDKQAHVSRLLDKASDLTGDYEPSDEPSHLEGKYAHMKDTYFRFLKEREARKAIQYIKSLDEQGIPLEDIYVDILQEVMTEVGELWQQRRIGVDEEHYMTAITQTVLSLFYDKIFSAEPNGKTALACSVGSELHEMGGRMVSDMLSMNGFDTTYLGAAVPKEIIMRRLKKEKPHYLLLSVTMPQHLLECRDIVDAVKSKHPDVKVAVGGRAFTMTDKLYQKWPIDHYADSAKSLIRSLKGEPT